MSDLTAKFFRSAKYIRDLAGDWTRGEPQKRIKSIKKISRHLREFARDNPETARGSSEFAASQQAIRDTANDLDVTLQHLRRSLLEDIGVTWNMAVLFSHIGNHAKALEYLRITQSLAEDGNIDDAFAFKLKEKTVETLTALERENPGQGYGEEARRLQYAPRANATSKSAYLRGETPRPGYPS